MKPFVRVLLILCGIGLFFLSAALVFSRIMVHSTQDAVISQEEAAGFDADCILVLGCGVLENGTPTRMLRDRLETARSLYEAGAAPKILLSGDHGQKDYDEVNVMKAYLLERGIPDEDLFMDHAGFSTYESICRAKEVFAVRSAIIVTQAYHLPRALYLAKSFGIEVCGVAAPEGDAFGQPYRDLRELAARSKDFFTAILHPAPTFLGEVIPITGSGTVTNDQ